MSATRASKKKMAQIVYDKYMHDRVFPNAVAHVNALKEEDYKIVLVTGSLDFMIEPLARVLRRVLFTLVPIRPRRRGERRSLRTFPVASLRPGSLAFNPDTPRRLSTPLLTPFNSTPTFA